MNKIKFLKENKAQTALEVILIVGGVLVLVTVIGYYLKTKVVETQDTNKLIDIMNKTAGSKIMNITKDITTTMPTIVRIKKMKYITLAEVKS